MNHDPFRHWKHPRAAWLFWAFGYLWPGIVAGILGGLIGELIKNTSK